LFAKKHMIIMLGTLNVHVLQLRC